jgi:glycosyltransferase involved in cell wall biosynthesis
MRNGERVRVLLVSPCFGAYGGIEAFVFAVAEAVRRDPRFEIRVCFKRTANFALQPELKAYCQGTHVEFCDRASRDLWSAIGWADVVHAQNASPDVAFAAKLLGKPLAVSVHNVLPDGPFHRRSSWRLAASLANARWYNSNFVWRSWEETGPKPGSSHVPPLSRLTDCQIPSDTRKGFVYLGRLVPGKGVDILVDAYHQTGLDAEEWPLTILGDGPLRVQLEALSSLAHRPGIRFAGFVDGAAKFKALASAKWLVVPSRWREPFGLVAVEARSLGVPCIVTRDGGLPEAAGRDALVCEPADVDSLREALGTAVGMSEAEYQQRSTRTRDDLANEIVSPSFYPDSYLRLCRPSPGPDDGR